MIAGLSCVDLVFEPMTVAAAEPPPEAPSAGIGALAERYDPDAIDLPGGAARVRLQIDGGRVWDAVLTRRQAQPPAAAPTAPSPTRRSPPTPPPGARSPPTCAAG